MPATTLAVLIALASGAPPAASPEPPPADCPVASGAHDWAGRYEAGEGHAGPPPMVMTYRADVFRDGEGRWRAFVWVSGQTTFRELRACGIESPHALELRGRPRDAEGEDAAAESIFTIERTRRGALRFRIPGGSYLLDQPVIDATRQPLPPWTGVFTAETCPEKDPPCWRYRLEVSPADDGWGAQVSVDGPETAERVVARGEDGDLAGGSSKLWLTFVRAGPGDAHRGAPRKAEEKAGTLVRRKDGSAWLELDGLPGPAGLRELPLAVQPKP